MICNGIQYNTPHFEIKSRNIWFTKYSKLSLGTLVSNESNPALILFYLSFWLKTTYRGTVPSLPKANTNRIDFDFRSASSNE